MLVAVGTALYARRSSSSSSSPPPAAGFTDVGPPDGTLCDGLAIPPQARADGGVRFFMGITERYPMNVALARCLIGSGVVDPRATSVVNGKEYSLLQMTMRANLLMKPDAAQKAAFPTYFLLCHEMIAKGADPRVNLGGGITPLHVAAYYRQFYLARAMIEAGADPSARTDGGKSPMAYVWMSTNNLLSVVAHIELNAQPLDHPDFSRGGVYPIEQLVRLSPTAAELWRSRNSSSTPDTLSQLRARDVLSDWNYAFLSLFVRTPDGATENLHSAVWHGDEASTALLLRLGGDAMRAEPTLGRLPHHLAALRGFDKLRAALGGTWQEAERRPDKLGLTPSSLKQGTRGVPSAPALAGAATSPGARGRRGGWSGEVATELVIDTCAIEQRGADISAEEFISEFVLKSKPVVLRGVASDWALRRRWTKQHFTEKYGDVPFSASAIPYGSSFGLRDHVRTLAQYIDALPTLRRAANESAVDPTYVFDTKAMLETRFREVAEDVEVPPPFLRSDAFKDLVVEGAIVRQFYLGPAYSGAPVHFHSDAWNVLAFGLKRWSLFPPSKSFYSKIPAYRFFREHLAEYEPLECMQYPGDVVYVPLHWGHAVLNAQDSIGLAVEFSMKHDDQYNQ